MQNCGSSILTVLQGTQRDLPDIDLFEFYAPDETNLYPENAAKRYAATEIIWYGWKYEREAVSRGEISRFIDGKFNNVSISFANVDRTVGTWLSTTEIEGYRVVIRCISRSVDDESVVLGVFRCEKPFDVDNTTVQINAKQDLGSIENDLPWNIFQPKCPLTFKGTECLAGQELTDKSAAYQAATVCNKSWRQCRTDYDNGKAFQGVRYNAITGNFKVSQQRGGAGGAFLGLIGLGNKKVTKQYSSQDVSPYGRAWPLGMGRTQLALIPLKYADTGQYLAGQWGIGEGELTKLLNVRNVTDGWADTFQAYDEHLGQYGYDPDQAPSGFFGSDFDHHSHKGYIEATIKGENPDTGDPAPTIAAVVLWMKIPTFENCFSVVDFSDNPVEHLRALLTDVRSLNYNELWIDDAVAEDSALYCNDAMIDESGAEDVYISSGSGVGGTDFKRYRSTGILDTYYYRWVLGLDADHSATREVTYNTFDPAAEQTITPNTYYRKRYTSNWHIVEQVRAVDFIFKSLLPSFRGYLITGADGRLQIKCEKPAVSSLLRGNVSIGATSLPIEDAYAWQQLNLAQVFCLVAAGEATSETREVTAIEYSTAGNSITLAASGSGTASGATLSGGSTSVQASGTVTIGSVAACTITIDGIPISYTPNGSDTTGTIAAILATKINADETLQRYIQATWVDYIPTQIRITSKLGTLTVAALTSAHSLGDQVVHIHLPFSDVAFGALTRGNISQGSFSWPLGGRQSGYNQFTMTYTDAPQDFETTILEENAEEHQEQVNKKNKFEISGACVDNYHQASRLVVGARYKYREGDFFCSWQTTDGRALLLEEGDIVCANHTNMPNNRNLLLRIEELKVDQEHRVKIIARKYADDQFPTSPDEVTNVLTTGIGWPTMVPPAVTNLVLTEPETGTIRGTFTFTQIVVGQYAIIEILRNGEVDFVDTGIRVSPDEDNNGAFEIPGVPSGETTVRVTPVSSTGVVGPSVTATINGNTDILEAQVMDLMEYQVANLGMDVLEVEVMS